LYDDTSSRASNLKTQLDAMSFGEKKEFIEAIKEDAEEDFQSV
jgi:hypothetical protein